MSDLKASLLSANETLHGLSIYLANRDSRLFSELQQTWVDHWSAKLAKIGCLGRILEDIDERAIACQALYDFPLYENGLSTSVTPPGQVLYGRTPLRPELARYIFVTAYLSLTWSVYDSLYDFFTRMTGSSEITDNEEPRKNKKLNELFEGDKYRSFVCYGHDGLYKQKLTWIYKVSYVIRNAFMHEGGRIKGEAVLVETLSNSFFNISDSTKEYFRRLYNVNSPQFQNCALNRRSSGGDMRNVFQAQGCAQRNQFPWFDNDIRTILVKYNSYLDDMFSRMIAWSVNSLASQIELMLGVTTGVPLAKVV